MHGMLQKNTTCKKNETSHRLIQRLLKPPPCWLYIVDTELFSLGGQQVCVYPGRSGRRGQQVCLYPGRSGRRTNSRS